MTLDMMYGLWACPRGRAGDGIPQSEIDANAEIAAAEAAAAEEVPLTWSNTTFAARSIPCRNRPFVASGPALLWLMLNSGSEHPRSGSASLP